MRHCILLYGSSLNYAVEGFPCVLSVGDRPKPVPDDIWAKYAERLREVDPNISRDEIRYLTTQVDTREAMRRGGTIVKRLSDYPAGPADGPETSFRVTRERRR